MNSPIVIIGSGFAARSVASRLPIGLTTMLERGEYRSHEAMVRRFDQRSSATAEFWENARHAYRSDLPENTPYTLSDRCFSQFEFIGGGSSNRWSGTATPLSRQVFAAQPSERHQWAISYEDLWPYYAKAAALLDVSIDPADSDLFPGRPEFNSAAYWHDLLEPVFGAVRLRSEAKNVRDSTRLKSRCCGAANCEICPEDAKTRPDNVFDHPFNIDYSTRAEEIEFHGQTATAVICSSPEGMRRYPCRSVVVAANAIESVALLRRSTLPQEVPRHLVGNYYHDHAVARLIVKIPSDIRYRYADTNIKIELCNFTRVRRGIEVLLEALPALPDQDAFTQAACYLHAHEGFPVHHTAAWLNGLLMIGVGFEMPPELGIRVSNTGPFPRLEDAAYVPLIKTYDAIMDEIIAEFSQHAIPVVGENRWYRHSYGCHHLMGTLAMAAPPFNATDGNALLTGTTNCFVAGSSLIPRAGARNPTLTLTALGLRLGDHLARQLN